MDLLAAVRRDDQAAVAALADAAADACERDGAPWSCIAEALRLGHRGCALRLMERVPGLSPASRRHALAGMLAGPLDDPVLFVRLLDRGANLPLGQGPRPIEHECAELAHPRIVRALFRRLGLRPAVADDAGWPPLLRAIAAGDPATAEVFLDHGAHINARSGGPDRRGALHLAVGLGAAAAAAVACLLGRGIDPELVDATGRTARDRAVSLGREDLAQTIERHRPAALPWQGIAAEHVDPNRVDEQGWTPFLRAVHAGDTAIAQVFLDQGADLNTRIEWADRRGALHLALEAADDPERLVSWLLTRGIDIGLRDDAGRTAAMLARSRGLAPLADLIEAHGGRGGPPWHREALAAGLAQVICTYRSRGEGFGFDARQVTHPFLLGGDHDGVRRARPLEAREHLARHAGPRGGAAGAWPTIIDRMLAGEEVHLADLLPLGQLVDDYYR